MAAFNSGAVTNTGDTSDFWGSVFGGVSDIFSQGIDYFDRKDERRNPTPTATSGGGSTPSPASANYQKWGLWVAVGALLLGVLALAIRK